MVFFLLKFTFAIFVNIFDNARLFSVAFSVQSTTYKHILIEGTLFQLVYLLINFPYPNLLHHQYSPNSCSQISTFNEVSWQNFTIFFKIVISPTQSFVSYEFSFSVSCWIHLVDDVCSHSTKYGHSFVWNKQMLYNHQTVASFLRW